MSTVPNMPATGEIVVGLDKRPRGGGLRHPRDRQVSRCVLCRCSAVAPMGGSRGPRSRRRVRPRSAGQLRSA